MMDKKLDRRRIVNFIDRREWKHSWHLPRNERGDIDWYSGMTKAALLKILERNRWWAIHDASQAQELIDMVEAMEVEDD